MTVRMRRSARLATWLAAIGPKASPRKAAKVTGGGPSRSMRARTHRVGPTSIEATLRIRSSLHGRHERLRLQRDGAGALPSTNVRPRPARGAPRGDEPGAPLRPRVRHRLRGSGHGLRAPAGRGARRGGAGGLLVLGALGVLGVGELRVVRVGLRHGRLALPTDDDGADDRSAHRGDGRARRLLVDRSGRRGSTPCCSAWTGSTS